MHPSLATLIGSQYRCFSRWNEVVILSLRRPHLFSDILEVGNIPFSCTSALDNLPAMTARPTPTHPKRVSFFPVIYIAVNTVFHRHHYTNNLLRPIAIRPSSPLVPCYSHPQVHFQLSSQKARNCQYAHGRMYGRL